MDYREYMLKVEEICKREFWNRIDLARELNVAYPTLVRLLERPQVCSLKTLKKVKTFVENWESKKQ